MIGIVDWAAARARMVIAFVILSITAGALAYVNLPKEGEPDIEIPALFVSVPFPGISAADSERLLVRTMETELADIDGLKTLSGTAAENYAGVALEFEFGWDKTKIMADVRDAMNTAEGKFPDGFEKYSINEINFSEFPIIIVNLTGSVPERTLIRVAQDLQDRLEGLDAVLKASLAGYRDEMVEVEIDPLRLEAYNVTADELIGVVQSNNQLIAAGNVKTASGSSAVKIPSSFDDLQDIYQLPVKVNGDSVVTLGDLATIRLTFEDRDGTARFNGQTSVALQVVKRKGFNLIDTAAKVREEVAAASAQWPAELQQAVHAGTSNDQSIVVDSMVKQLEGSVITAIALVMIVVLAALGIRSALLVGFAIPTSFLLTFALFGVLDVTISNIVMFGLILAVGMLVDGAIVVVEYADKKISEGVGPMEAYTRAAKRMFWPIVSSTATTLCAFLPMLFWPGIPGQFMGWLPKTLIFVLSASLLVALVYLPVVGGVSGRFERWFQARVRDIADARGWVHLLLFPAAASLIVAGIFLTVFCFTSASSLVGAMDQSQILLSVIPNLIGAFLLYLGTLAFAAIIVFGALLLLFSIAALFKRLGRAVTAVKSRLFPKPADHLEGRRRRTALGHLIHFIAANPIMPLVVIGFVFTLVGSVFIYFLNNNKGVEFFTDSEPEQAIIFVRARGNLSIAEKDAMVAKVERIALSTKGVESVFAFAGNGGLNQNTGGASGPRDTIGQLQLELVAWADRPSIEKDIKLFGFLPFTTSEIDPQYDGDFVMAKLEERLAKLPGIRFEVLNLNRGPASAKPVQLRLKGDDWTTLRSAMDAAVAKFNATPGLVQIEDTLPLPGIDWQLDVDVEKAGRYGTNVATVGGMVQLVTNGILLDTMRVDSSDEEIEIRVRLPEEQRLLSTLDTLKLRTPTGLVPLSNFVTRQPVRSLGQINRVDQSRYYDVKAGVVDDVLLYSAVPLNEAGELVEEGAISLGFGYRVTEEEKEQGDPTNLTVTTKQPWYLSWLLDPTVEYHNIPNVSADISLAEISKTLVEQKATLAINSVTPNERIATLNKWLETAPFPDGVTYEWTGDQEDEAESQAFLGQAFIGALFLMFIILLAQFNSFYNSVLVLLAVVLSTTGVLIGMMVMGQAFSIIMTGTGIVALAGIVVNNNIVLIDTYQDYSRYMPRIEAITRTAEARIRPVLLTTITTMAGLAPMMFGLSLNFVDGGYSIDSPTALWWKQLATAVVFGLGIATVLTLVFTPSMLALRVWISAGAYRSFTGLRALAQQRGETARDVALASAARKTTLQDLVWDDQDVVRSYLPEDGDMAPSVEDIKRVLVVDPKPPSAAHGPTNGDGAGDKGKQIRPRNPRDAAE